MWYISSSSCPKQVLIWGINIRFSALCDVRSAVWQLFYRVNEWVNEWTVNPHHWLPRPCSKHLTSGAVSSSFDTFPSDPLASFARRIGGESEGKVSEWKGERKGTWEEGRREMGKPPSLFSLFSHGGEMGKKVKGVGVTYKERHVGICTLPSRSIDHS